MQMHISKMYVGLYCSICKVCNTLPSFVFKRGSFVYQQLSPVQQFVGLKPVLFKRVHDSGVANTIRTFHTMNDKGMGLV